MKDVVGLGALNVDLVYEIKRPRLNGVLSKKIERGGEVVCSEEEYRVFSEFIRKVGKFVWQSGGGQAANTCFALARWGFSTGFVGKVGQDEFGLFLKNSLEGVDISGISTDEESGVSLIVVDQTGERTIFVFPNANDKLELKDVDLNFLFQTRFVYFSSFAGENGFKLQETLAELLPKELSLTVDIGELYARKGFEKLKPILSRSRVMFATEKEICLLTGKQLDEAVDLLLELGVEVIAVKRGVEGARIVTQTKDFLIPAQKVEAVDTTGAGDVFAAGFLAGLLKGLNFEQSGRLATLLAARSITGYGRSAYPDLAFFEQVLKEVAV